jgi:hypothetical protein
VNGDYDGLCRCLPLDLGGTMIIYFQRKQNDPKWWFFLGTYWFTSGWNGVFPKKIRQIRQNHM